MDREISDNPAAIDLVLLVSRASAKAWHYWQEKSFGAIELGLWIGDCAPGLRTHFHDEAQIVFVQSGSRSFLVNNRVILVKAGQCAYIPAGTPHTGLAMHDRGTSCLNAYVPAFGAGRSAKVIDIPDKWRRLGSCHIDELRKTFQKVRSLAWSSDGLDLSSCRWSSVINNIERIGALAANAGRSREAFSRQFKRDIGISPHAFRVITRLNLARQLLREGGAPAAVAADAGFADQSHLGRAFRLTFGTTPGNYRRF